MPVTQAVVDPPQDWSRLGQGAHSVPGLNVIERPYRQVCGTLLEAFAEPRIRNGTSSRIVTGAEIV